MNIVSNYWNKFLMCRF